MKKSLNSIYAILAQKAKVCIRLSAAAVMVFAVSFPLCAVQKTIVLGGENGWNNIATMDGVTTGSGRYGFESIELETQTPALDGETDILLSFENGQAKDLAGKYVVVENHLVPSSESIKGKGAALSRGVERGITLNAVDGEFESTRLSGSFSIEFWINPSLAENGEKIYNWSTTMNYEDYSDFQTVNAVFVNNRLEWKFKNIFPTYKSGEVVLRGYRAIVPGGWSRHTISYDEETGCLEYLVDGNVESIRYITSTDHESGTICIPVIGRHAKIELCPNFTGKIDNVRITRSPCTENRADIFSTGNEPYRVEGGRFISRPILVSRAATLDSIDALMNVPGQTAVKLFVRAGDNCYGWSDSYPAWTEVTAGYEITDVKGMYFQVAAELLPDGMGKTTPSITQLTLNYTEAELPLPPFIVNAESGDGQVTLTWSYSVDETTAGYYVYYGTRPGEYLGRTAVEGASPVKAGNTTSITLTGLKNGTIYYFAVSSYSSIDGRLRGELSREVYARPSKHLVKR